MIDGMPTGAWSNRYMENVIYDPHETLPNSTPLEEGDERKIERRVLFADKLRVDAEPLLLQINTTTKLLGSPFLQSSKVRLQVEFTEARQRQRGRSKATIFSRPHTLIVRPYGFEATRF